MSIEDKRGMFVVPRELLVGLPELVKPFLAEVLIVQAELVFARNWIEYTALSEYFDECDPGAPPLLYNPCAPPDG